MSIFGDLRKAAGLTQEAVANLAGYSPRQVRRWEAGRARIPKLVMDLLINLTTKEK